MKNAIGKLRGGNSFTARAGADAVRLWSITVLSVSNLAVNKLRTFLTLLGVIVGVASIIAVVTIIKGLDSTVANTFSANGATVFSLSKGPSVITSREDFLKIGRRRDITEEDAGAAFRGCPLCIRMGYAAFGRETVKYADIKLENVSVRGITDDVPEIEALTVDAGRFWSRTESETAQNVAVIGADIVKNAFGDADPESVIGKEIRVRGALLRVIGVATPLGSFLGVSRDNFVLMPYRTAMKILPRRESLIVSFQVADAADLETAKDQVATVMRGRRQKIVTYNNGIAEEDDGFTIESADVFLGLYSAATDNIYFVTIGVSAISLVVGGIVVMNIMLVSVAERRKEIGLRMAVGARRIDILRQFLIETVVLTLGGGLVGIVVGFLLAKLISIAIGFPMLINPASVILGIGVSSAVGIISGIYPAWRAASLSPVEAMRYE
jgi:putative ABC transport system permease protein